MFTALDIKLWHKEENHGLHAGHLRYLLKFIHSKVKNFYKMLFSFSYNRATYSLTKPKKESCASIAIILLTNSEGVFRR